MGLFWRIWSAVAVVNLIVLTLFVGLSTLQFGNINAELVAERLSVIAKRTAAPFEAAARIGLPLSTVRNAQALLERARQTDERIKAIHVFDASGSITHSTLKDAPATIPKEVARTRSGSKDTSWHQETAEGFFSSIEVRSTDGGSAGGILIVYSSGENLTRILAMTSQLAFEALLVLVASVITSLLLLRLALGRQISLFEEIESDVASFETDAWRSAAGEEHSIREDTGDLYRLLKKTEYNYRQAGHKLTTARGGNP